MKGQLLLEVLIALTILGLVAVAVAKVSTGSLKSSRVTGDRKEALDLAKQVLANVENEKVNNTILFFSGNSGTESCDNGGYVCVVTYTYDSPPDSNSVTVEVKVTVDGNNVVLDKIFTKTRL